MQITYNPRVEYSMYIWKKILRIPTLSTWSNFKSSEANVLSCICITNDQTSDEK